MFAHGVLERIRGTAVAQRDRLAVENERSCARVRECRNDFRRSRGDVIAGARIDADFIVALVHLDARTIELPFQRRHRDARHADGDAEYAPRPEAVGDPATDRDAHRKAQNIARHHRLEAQRRNAEARRHRRNRGVDDGRVELLHEQRGRDHPRQIALGRNPRRRSGFRNLRLDRHRRVLGPGLFQRDPFVDARLEHRQRQRAIVEQCVVKAADVELVAERCMCLGA